MNWGVVVFPGSNDDRDTLHALADVLGYRARALWHGDDRVGDVDAIVLPGGFSYGDYLRCGAMARFSPIMKAVAEFARAGGPVLGICNGFQILCEAGLLPGALVRNSGLQFVCRTVAVRVESTATAFSAACRAGEILHIPVKHGEGCYVADPETLERIERMGSVVFRYDGGSPNGSLADIAGVANEAGNVVGLMPHPEHAVEEVLAGSDGRRLFVSAESWLAGAGGRQTA
ncbi:MAG: phosphoribosylformylglycinamidine synthase subunit PurQ [Candidatus Dadabacteria bacterium]|nr:MAG: phosphoribosylformylglycinamidine synthase subunit PurQ [Candidatus Dadabacteria bacterium]